MATGGAQHPLLEKREIRNSGIVLMTADKGLAGAFNSNLARAGALLARESTNPRFYLVGIKGRVQIRTMHFAIEADWPLQSKPFADLARDVAARVSDDFLSGKVDAVTLVASRFVSTIVQRPVRTELLPIAPRSAPQSLRRRRLPQGCATRSNSNPTQRPCWPRCCRSISSSQFFKRCWKPKPRNLRRA